MESIILSTAVALGVGLLMGAERERSKGSRPEREIAGVRTFALTSLFGLFGALFDNAVVLAAFTLLLGAVTVAGYLRTRDADPGVTTEVALFAAFALGALSLSHPEYSAGAAVVITVLLASRPWLHELVTSRMSDRELHDGLLLAAAALIVLPLLPDRTIDPWEVLNPRKMWVVVVLVMAINAAGYIGLRLWGAGRGLMLAGFLGGLVSSAATHGAMGHRAKSEGALVANTAAAATISSVTTAVLLVVVVGSMDAALARTLAAPAAAAALVSAGYAWLLYRGASGNGGSDIALGRPVSLRAGLLFGAVVSGVLVLSALLSRTFGPGAALASVTAAGFADAHSGAISAALLERKGVLTLHTAQVAALLSFSSNALTKIVISFIAGTRAFGWRIGVGVLASVSAAWIVWWGQLMLASQ